MDPSEAAPTLDQGQDNLSSANLDNRRSQLTIGIDPVDSGFNPHLAANDYSFVQSLAALVFPSAFVQGQLNTDLLVSAEEIPPAEGAAQTIRYVINPDAQWNDGTPISYADFYYLWDSMRDNPDVINGAGYRAIKAMRTSDGGKKIEIDFDQRIRDWNELFDNILPAHLLKDATGGFDGALKTSIPASGGRYAVKDIDFARGIYTIVRNDRFWGNNPAATEVLQFREIRSVTQGVEMLRSGQLNFVDASPTETAELSYDLIPDAQVRAWDRNSTLTIDFNTASTRMPTPELRKQLAGLIDTEQLAILATGRRTNIAAIPKTINNDAAGNDSTADELRALSPPCDRSRPRRRHLHLRRNGTSRHARRQRRESGSQTRRTRRHRTKPRPTRPYRRHHQLAPHPQHLTATSLRLRLQHGPHQHKRNRRSIRFDHNSNHNLHNP